jgi:hypothetical protein
MANILLAVDVDDETMDLEPLVTALTEAGFHAMDTRRTFSLRFPPDVASDDLLERIAFQGPEWYVKTAVDQAAEDLGARVRASYLIATKSDSAGRPTSYTAEP